MVMKCLHQMQLFHLKILALIEVSYKTLQRKDLIFLMLSGYTIQMN